MVTNNYAEKEKIRQQLTEKMFELAYSVGSGRAVVQCACELWFDTWQDGLDFQAFAQDEGLPLRLIEAKPKPVRWADEYYKLSPILEN